MRRSLLALAAFALCFRATSALAYYGWASGRILFYDTRSYAAAPGDGPYTTSMQNTWHGLPNVKVYILLNGTSTVIGTGGTDDSGNFDVFWSSGVSNPSITMNFYYESSFNASGVPRFRIATASGGNWVSWTAPITSNNYTTSSFGDLYYGSSADPHKLCTMFATANDFWVTIGQTSANLDARLSGVQVRFPVGDSASSALTVSRSRIDMPDGGQVFDNSTLAHEFGHVVQEVEFEQDLLWGDCTWDGSTHGWDGAEWQSCASIEGWADFVAAATFFYPWATSPTSYGWDIETGCSGPNEWTESNVARMYWDIYDSVNEPGEGLQQPFYWLVDKWNVFPDGTWNRQDREARSNRNGLNSWDFYYHALYSGNGTNVDIQSTLEHNCLYDSQW